MGKVDSDSYDKNNSKKNGKAIFIKKSLMIADVKRAISIGVDGLLFLTAGAS